MLDKDIRKVPAAAVFPRRRQSTLHPCPGSASTEQTSVSTSSALYDPSSTGFSSPAVDTPPTSVADMLQPSPLKPPTKKGRGPRDHPLRRQPTPPSQSQHCRYWNEFDDGDEASDPETYTILVNPHNSRSLPGTAGISRLGSLIASFLTLSTQQVKQWLQPHPEASLDARRRLNSNHAASDQETLSSPDDGDGDDDDEEEPTTSQIYTQPIYAYSTFPAPKPSTSIHQALRNRDKLLFRLSIASFAFSFTTLFIAATLVVSARRKAHLAADLGILVGVIAALTSAVTGLAIMYSREVSRGWVGAILLLLFVAICGVCGELLTVVGSV